MPATTPSRTESDPAAEVAKLEVVEHLRKTHGIRGALAEFRVDDTECMVSFKGPGYSADTFIDRDSGDYTLTELDHGLIALINDLHKGRDTGAVWSAVIDLSAGLMTIISLTGLVLLFYLKLAHPRRGGGPGRDHRPHRDFPVVGAVKMSRHTASDVAGRSRPLPDLQVGAPFPDARPGPFGGPLQTLTPVSPVRPHTSAMTNRKRRQCERAQRAHTSRAVQKLPLGCISLFRTGFRWVPD